MIFNRMCDGRLTYRMIDGEGYCNDVASIKFHEACIPLSGVLSVMLKKIMQTDHAKS